MSGFYTDKIYTFLVPLKPELNESIPKEPVFFISIKKCKTF